MRTTVLIIGACLLVSACETMPRHESRRARPGPVTTVPAEPQPAHPLVRSTSYTCEDLSTITFTEGQPGARATLNSGLNLSLSRRGAHYGAPPYEFRQYGNQGEWHANGKVFRCRRN